MVVRAAVEPSPLVEIERAVHRPRCFALDVATPDEAAKLETLIDEEIAARVNDHKRGLTSSSPTRHWSPRGPSATWPATASSGAETGLEPLLTAGLIRCVAPDPQRR